MKTFSIVLSTVTISTVLAMFILTGALQELQKTISGSILNPKQKLRKLMLEHPPKLWGKERFCYSRTPVEQLRLWMYLAFLVELCFMRVPVHEVKEAIDLYGSRYFSHTDTAFTSGYRQDTEEACPISLARRVAELYRAERESARKGFIRVTARQAGIVLFTAARILLLCVWVPLILLSYVALIFCCPFMGPPTQCDSQHRISKCERLKHFFTTPLEFLGLDLSQFQTRGRRGEHEYCSPDPFAGSSDLELVSFSHSDFRPSPVAGDRPPGTGREPHMHGAQRIRDVIARSTFQAEYQQRYPSGQNPAGS
jgi:hypothetical protein